MKIFKVFWVILAIASLFVTLYGFDGKPNSDIGIVSAWTGLLLSFPFGLLVSLAHVFITEIFSVTINVSYISLMIDWVSFAVLGYAQWFVFLPWIYRKWKARVKVN